MATRLVLGDLAEAYGHRSGCAVEIESVGGLDAARRVEAGEPFDVVFLASNAIDKLVASGQVVRGSKVDLVHSDVAIAVRAGSPRPDTASEDAVRRAVLEARTVGYSTGPSGVALTRLFERWGIASVIAPRVVQAPPGVPVGELVARGEVALGFQQLSELMFVDGIDVLGRLPRAIQITTTFSGGLCSASSHGEEVRRLLDFMGSSAAAEVKRRHGLEPADTTRGTR